jgi:hypothetical protein
VPVVQRNGQPLAETLNPAGDVLIAQAPDRLQLGPEVATWTATSAAECPPTVVSPQ